MRQGRRKRESNGWACIEHACDRSTAGSWFLKVEDEISEAIHAIASTLRAIFEGLEWAPWPSRVRHLAIPLARSIGIWTAKAT